MLTRTSDGTMTESTGTGLPFTAGRVRRVVRTSPIVLVSRQPWYRASFSGPFVHRIVRAGDSAYNTRCHASSVGWSAAAGTCTGRDIVSRMIA